MPKFAGFADLNDYLTRRCREQNISMNALSEELGWTHSYIHGVATGAFIPSGKRVDQIAAKFGDNPRILRILAGLELPPTDEDKESFEIKEIIASLTPVQRRELLKYAHYLKAQGSKGG